MAFFLKAIGLSDDIPGFPFTPAASDPGHIVYTSPLMCWTVRSGTPHDDAQKKVSIFTCSLASSSSSSPQRNNSDLVRQLARNALRRAKSLMLPGVLKCFGATEYRDTIYIATEACVSLKEVLESREMRTQLYGTQATEYHASVAYGLSSIGEGLAALHHNRLVHGNVNCQSIFVLPSSGMWRLFGLELVSSADEVGSGSASCVLDSAVRAQVLEGYRCPPELQSSGAGNATTGAASPADASAIDAWGLAGLLYETVGVTVDEAADGKLGALTHTLASADLRNACRASLPKSLHSGCSAITAANPRMRKSVAAFLENCEFIKDSTFVQYMKGLSEALLLDAAQQVRLVESLADVVDSFPLRPCLCYVLPRLGELVRAAAKPGSASGVAGVSIGPVVAPALKIAARVSAGDDFDQYVTPVLVLMFQLPDALMRYKLLVGAEVYGGKLSASALNNAIWPLYAKGFQYPTPSVREYSARALVHLAPHLSESVLADQVPKALALLQRDQDGALRANATIALHLISSHIHPPTQRASVILTSCRPMLRDAFEPSRVAALRSLRGAIDCMTAKQLAEAVLPAVAPLTIDPVSEESRSAALALIKAATTKLEENHRHLTARQPAVPSSSDTGGAGAAAAASNAAHTTAATSTASSSPLPAIDAAASSSNGASATSSWGWGLFSGSPPATPAITTATTTTTTTNVAAAPLRHVDAASSSASSSVPAGAVSSGIRPSPLPTSASSPAPAHVAAVLPAPIVSAAAADVGGGGTGWSDDDGDDVEFGAGGGDGWGSDGDGDDGHPSSTSVASAPASEHMKVRPLAPTATRGGVSGGGGGAAAPLRTSAAQLTGAAARSSMPVSSSSSTVSHVGAPPATTPLPTTGSGGGISGAGSPTSTAPSPGPMKLRKKGGLGAARLD